MNWVVFSYSCYELILYTCTLGIAMYPLILLCCCSFVCDNFVSILNRSSNCCVDYYRKSLECSWKIYLLVLRICQSVQLNSIMFCLCVARIAYFHRISISKLALSLWYVHLSSLSYDSFGYEIKDSKSSRLQELPIQLLQPSPMNRWIPVIIVTISCWLFWTYFLSITPST